MRTLALIAFVGGLTAAAAEPVRKSAVIAADGVEVRAGHAMSFPTVSELRRDDTVIVVREEETGFLAILPPRGSVSWVKQIHLSRIEAADGKANVPVAVDGAEVMAGNLRDGKPTNRVTAKLPKGTIVEVTGPAVRIDNTSWCPVTPPEGDLRWVPRSALKASSLLAIAPPPVYAKNEAGFTVPGAPKGDAAARPAVEVPRALADHRLYPQASQGEQRGDHAAAKADFARIYQDLWDQKADREAIVACYNAYTRCDEAMKKGFASRTEPRTTPATPVSRSESSGSKWSGPGYLNEMQKVTVDGKPVYSLQDDRGNVMYYVTAVDGINPRNFNGKRVQAYGTIVSRAELYKPHLTAEKLELAR